MIEPTPDLAIVVVSANNGRWLERCLRTAYAHAGGARLEVIVVDNGSTDGTRELVKSHFPEARVVRSENWGFGFGNNRGFETSTARYTLFLNPDTEIVDGTFGALVQSLDRDLGVGVLGVRQVSPGGIVWPTIRRFPSVSRALGEALVSERWPVHPAWSGERVLDSESYARETSCDWTSGSFMLVRRAALLSAGFFDERFFIYSEEPDLCLRIRSAGWEVRHVPSMTILHHANKNGLQRRLVAQGAYARKQYARKHFGPVRRRLYWCALALRHLLRSVPTGRTTQGAVARRRAAREALRVVLGLAEPPFTTPPRTALEPPAQRTRRAAVHGPPPSP